MVIQFIVEVVLKHFGTSVAILLVTFMTPVLVWAQTGIIAGKVTDGESGEPLRGATVQVVENKKGAYTDTKGTFRIKNIAPGSYTLKFSYVGYGMKTVEKVAVTADKTATINVVLSVTKSSAKEVVVEATRVNDNAAALLATRKNAAQVSDGIGREEISKLADSDAGQSLKRVSGVTLVDNKFVYVRGVSDRYSNTTLNGASLASTEPDKKSFAFDMFPSELLENANVAKSFTPDLPGNFAGGLVQLNTIDFPSGTSVKLSASSGYNDNVTLKTDRFLMTEGGKTDWLGIDDGSRALPAGFPASRLEMNELLREVRAGNQESIDRLNGLGRAFHNNLWSTGSTTAAPNGSFGVTYSDLFSTGESDQFGLVASMSYGNSYGLNNIVRGGLLANPQDYLFRFQGTQASRSVSWGGLVNMAYRIGTSTTISFKNVYNRSSDFENVYLSGENYAQSIVQRLFSFQFVDKTLYSGTVSGEHNLPFNNALVDWRLGYSQSERDEPDFRRLQFMRNTADSGQPLFAAFDLTPQGAGSRAGRFFSNLQDNAITGGLNFQLPVTTDVKIKVGGLVENRSRVFKARSITIVQSFENDMADKMVIPDNDVVPDLSPIFADSNYATNRLSYSEDSKLSDTYDAQENLVAGYAMVDFPVSIAGVDVRFITGARIEKSIQRLNSFSVTDNPVHVDQDLLDVLPSLNIVVKPSDLINVRLSASQTLARPSLREFAPFQFFDFQQQATIAGNPNLRRTLIQNYDVRFEYFTAPGQVLSASLFYKRFDNAIEETLFPQQSEVVRSFANASGAAHNYGVELEIRQSLGFIANPLNNFMLSLNAALIRSELTVYQATVQDTRPMWGQSPYTVNIALYYVNPDSRTSVTLGYNTYGKRIIQVNQVGTFQGNPHVYELARDLVDFSVIQPIGESWEIKLAVRDLLNQPLKWEQEGSLVQSNLRGRSVSLGFGYKIQ